MKYQVTMSLTVAASTVVEAKDEEAAREEALKLDIVYVAFPHEYDYEGQSVVSELDGEPSIEDVEEIGDELCDEE